MPLPFEIDDKPLEETLTSYGGVPLVTQAFRSLKAPASVRQHVQIKQRDRGLDEAAMVESFVVLNAVGGECLHPSDEDLSLGTPVLPPQRRAGAVRYARREEAGGAMSGTRKAMAPGTALSGSCGVRLAGDGLISQTGAERFSSLVDLLGVWKGRGWGRRCLPGRQMG